MNHASPEQISALYNNRALVPDHPAILEAWASQSKAARERMPQGRLDVPYGHAPLQKLDVFPPRATATTASSSTGLAPVLVFIHGGYWRSLDKAQHSFVAEPFVDKGALVVVPNYTLAPAIGIDGICLEMARALVWVWRHAHQYGGDPSRIVVAGHSAGGHLATMMLCCDWPRVQAGPGPKPPRDLVRSAMSISGVFDLQPLVGIPWLQPDLRLTATLARQVSPALYGAPAARRLLALVGGQESSEFIRQNRLIQEAWGQAVVPVCAEVPGRNHFDVLFDLADPSANLHTRLAQELSQISPP